MGVMAHFFSKTDIVRYDIMLDLCQTMERSTSDALWRQLRDILHRFGIQHKIGSVTIDSGARIVKAVEEDGFQDVPRKPTVVRCYAHVVDQSLVHRAFSLVSKAGRRIGDDGLDKFYQREFLPFRKCLQTSLGDGSQLMGTSLQYAPHQLATNHTVMVAAQLWKRTAYWVRQEKSSVTMLTRLISFEGTRRRSRARFTIGFPNI